MCWFIGNKTYSIQEKQAIHTEGTKEEVEIFWIVLSLRKKDEGTFSISS